MKNILLGSFLIILGAGCASIELPDASSDQFVLKDDEKRLWLRSEEEEKRLLESGLVYKDKELEAYLNTIAGRLQDKKIYDKIPFKILILRNPYCNAFAFPNGYVFVHTGILSRMENESQLATLLAHEMTHATHRHAVRNRRNLKNKTALVASLEVSIGTLSELGSLVNVLGDIGTTAALSGYSKDLETEADVEGIKLVEMAGYNTNEAPKLFMHMKEELEAEEIEEPFFFGTHPRLEERIENYNEYLKMRTGGSKGMVNEQAYEKKISNLLFDNSILDLQAGRFATAERRDK